MTPEQALALKKGDKIHVQNPNGHREGVVATTFRVRNALRVGVAQGTGSRLFIYAYGPEDLHFPADCKKPVTRTKFSQPSLGLA